MINNIYYKFAQLLDSAYLPKRTSNDFVIILQVALVILGAIALLMAVWAGFKIITSSGNSEKIASGRKTLIYAVIGLAIAIFAREIIIFFVGRS